MAGYREFLGGLIRNPKAVSAPTPSSPTLARIIASQVDPFRAGLVLELGPGTGVVTQALLDHGVAPNRLLAIEHAAFFVPPLSLRFPDVTIIQGDALAFENYLPANARIAAIVSGVPLLNFCPDRRRDLIERSLAVQGPGGRFIQLSYGWWPPVARVAGIRPSKTMVWRNLPPAHVWTYKSRSAPTEALPGSRRRRLQDPTRGPIAAHPDLGIG